MTDAEICDRLTELYELKKILEEHFKGPRFAVFDAYLVGQIHALETLRKRKNENETT